ncbi:tyrosine-protein phosphatase non-receptor type 23b [Trichomycterus rosablanca]|uniref:tyrosine-protein phosphatase non-receptor type 23b n=1 Tax=Trichomycterus rosablanca TaxID=2290929 RepID=UPI002F359B54
MPMIWLEVKEAGEFHFSSGVRQYIHLHYGENPENYNEALKKLEQLRQSVVNSPRDYEGCKSLRKYLGQLHYLQSRIPMAKGQEVATPVTWIDIHSGKHVTHDDISFEQACVLYNLGALHSYLGAMDNRVSEEGMKTSCTHFQSSAGAFTYIRDNYNCSYSSDISHQALSINISLMMAQAQECLLEKTLLDNRKSSLIARICAQVCDYYRDCVRALDSSEWTSGKKDWRKLIQMKISYFSAVKHLHMGKQSEEQQKFGEAVAYFQHSLNRLNEAIKLSKGQPDSVQDALRFTMDVIGGKFNSAKKDNDFIYHESVPAIDSLAAVKGVSLVKPVPVTLTDPSITGPDLFSKLVPMASHEASSLYSEEKAKLLREVMAKSDDKNHILERFMDSLNCDSVNSLDMFNTMPPALLEKCAALSVRPDAVKNLAQAMQALSGVYTDVSSYLEDIRNALEEDEAGEKSLLNVVEQKALPPRTSALQELQTEFKKYMTAHQAASQSNTELHKAMNQHIPNLRLLQGPLEELRKSLPRPQLSEDDMASLQTMKRLLAKVDDMRNQRILLEKQLRDLIQKDDITSVLVTTERFEIKALFEEQLKKYDQLKGYIDQNLAAQDNILKALTEANVKYAIVRKTVIDAEQKWNSSVQSFVASYEANEDLVKKAEEGRTFYQDLEKKICSLLDQVKTICQSREEERKALLDRDVAKGPPPRPTAQKPVLGNKASAPPAASITYREDLPQELRSLPPDMAHARGSTFPNITPHGTAPLAWPPGTAPTPFPNQRMPQLAHLPTAPLQPLVSGFGVPQQFQSAPPGNITPVPHQMNPNNPSQMTPQTYIPAPWQGPPSVPFPVSAGYPVPPQVGLQSATRPTVPGQPIPVPGGQFTNQHIPPGTQYQSFPPQIGQGMMFQRPGFPFPVSNQPVVRPGQIQPPVSLQSQLLPGPPLAQYTQSQPGLPSQQVPLPGQERTQPPPNQFHPGQFPQNLPHAYMGPVLPSVPSSQPQPKPRSSWNQTTPQVSFSQNPQVPLAQHSTNYPQMLPGAAVPQGSMYFQPGAAQTQVLHPATQNGMAQQQTTAQTNPMIPPGNPPQNIHSSSSGLGHVPVMDNPNPLTLTGILTPSPAGDLLKSSSTENAPGVTQSEETLKQMSQQDASHLLRDQLDQLSIASNETLKCESGEKNSTKQNGQESQTGDSVISDFDPFWT